MRQPERRQCLLSPGQLWRVKDDDSCSSVKDKDASQVRKTKMQLTYERQRSDSSARFKREISGVGPSVCSPLTPYRFNKLPSGQNLWRQLLYEQKGVFGVLGLIKWGPQRFSWDKNAWKQRKPLSAKCEQQRCNSSVKDKDVTQLLKLENYLKFHSNLPAANKLSVKDDATQVH